MHIPTFKGCKKCSRFIEGCTNCYEGNANLNFTSILVYEQLIFTFIQQEDYRNLYEVREMCTKCFENYEFIFNDYSCRTCDKDSC